MSQPTGPRPRLDVRGAIDLGALARTPTPSPGTPGGLPVPGAFVVDIDEASFPGMVQASAQYPVVVLLWAPWSQASIGLAGDLGRLAEAYQGRFQLARVDTEASPAIASAFQAQAVPSVVAVLGGQPVPLFQGSPTTEQVRGVLDQLLLAATQYGVTGTVPGAPEPAERDEPQEPALPPLHQAAYDAIERDDLPAARQAYAQALRENPRDALAEAGLAQVNLLERARTMDLRVVREAAAAAPDDVDAQLAVADADVLGGRVEDAFSRLVSVVRATSGPERERVRQRLLELFAVVGTDDPRVMAARRALANALY